jgi:hypothetical protein
LCGADVLAQPAHEWRCCLELGTDTLARDRLLQPRADLVAPSDRQAAPSQQTQARVIGWIAARRTNEVGLVQLETCILRAADCPGKRGSGTPGVDSSSQAVDLVWCGIMQPSGNQQSIE